VGATEQEIQVNLNRGLVFWGVALITAGAVALAIQAGAIAGDDARQLWRFWPVALIVIGLAVIAARTPFALVATIVAALVVGVLGGTLVSGWPEGFDVGCSGEPDELVSEDGSFAGDASVSIDFDCGDLAVSTGPGSDWSVDARYSGGDAPEITSDDGSLTVAAEGGDVFGLADARQAWDVTIPVDVRLDLSVDANAASSALDLGNARLSSLSIDANAGDITVRLPSAEVEDLSVDANAGSVSIETDASTSFTGSVEMNAGSLDLCVPDGVVFAITLEDDNITFSHNLDDSGLVRQGNTWVTGDTAVPSFTLQVDGNAASFTLNPEDGCS
jgi:hypothetical protein